MKKLLLAISLLVCVFQPSLAKKKNPLVKVETFRYVSTHDYPNAMSRDFQYEGAKYWEDRMMLDENMALPFALCQTHPEYVPLLQNAVTEGIREAKCQVVGHDSSDPDIKMVVGGDVTDIITHNGLFSSRKAEISVVLDISYGVPGEMSRKVLISTTGHGATSGRAVNSGMKALEKKVKKVVKEFVVRG